MCLWCTKWMPNTSNLQTVRHWGAQDLSHTYLDLIPLERIKTLVGASQRVVLWKMCVQKIAGSSSVHGLWSAKQIMWQATTNMAGLEKCGFFFLQKVLRFIAVDVTLWKFLVTPLKKGNRFPTPTLTPKILKNNYLCVLKLQRGVACDRWATTLDCALCTQSLTNSSLDI